MFLKSEYKAISIAIDVLNSKLESENSNSEDLIFAINTLNRWKNRADKAKKLSQKRHDLFKFLSELSDKQREKIIEHIKNVVVLNLIEKFTYRLLMNQLNTQILIQKAIVD